MATSSLKLKEFPSLGDMDLYIKRMTLASTLFRLKLGAVEDYYLSIAFMSVMSENEG